MDIYYLAAKIVLSTLLIVGAILTKNNLVIFH